MGQCTQAQRRQRRDQHGQRRADQRPAHERRRAAEELPIEVTAQAAADQPLTDLTAAIGQTDVQIPRNAHRRTDQQRPEQPWIGLAQTLPEPGEQGARRKQNRQPAPIDAAGVRNRRAVTEQILERRRHAQYHHQHPQTLPGRDMAEQCTVTGAEVDHLPGTTGHA